MAETSTDILEKLQTRIRAIKWTPTDREPDLQAELRKVINKALELTHSEYQKVEGDKDALKKAVTSKLEKERVFTDYRSNLNTYKRRHETHQNKHQELRKIENAQGLRNVFWRGASTFVVAGVIFFFYWLAGCFGVQLPLSRLGM
ncbi:hypothetical protein [Marinobacter shengliensis]